MFTALDADVQTDRPASPGACHADRALLRTITYASLFQFPLTLAELHLGLMDVPLGMPALRARLEGPFLRERVAVTGGFVHPRGREDWVVLRREREARTRALLDLHRRHLSALSGFPYVCRAPTGRPGPTATLRSAGGERASTTSSSGAG